MSDESFTAATATLDAKNLAEKVKHYLDKAKVAAEGTEYCDAQAEKYAAAATATAAAAAATAKVEEEFDDLELVSTARSAARVASWSFSARSAESIIASNTETINAAKETARSAEIDAAKKNILSAVVAGGSAHVTATIMAAAKQQAAMEAKKAMSDADAADLAVDAADIAAACAAAKAGLFDNTATFMRNILVEAKAQASLAEILLLKAESAAAEVEVCAKEATAVTEKANVAHKNALFTARSNLHSKLKGGRNA